MREILLTILFLLGQLSFAGIGEFEKPVPRGGHDGNNGGDSLSIVIQHRINVVKETLKEFNRECSIALSMDKQAFIDKVEALEVETTDDILYADNDVNKERRKECLWDRDNVSFVCNRADWKYNVEETFKDQLLIHEVLGLMSVPDPGYRTSAKVIKLVRNPECTYKPVVQSVPVNPSAQVRRPVTRTFYKWQKLVQEGESLYALYGKDSPSEARVGVFNLKTQKLVRTIDLKVPAQDMAVYSGHIYLRYARIINVIRPGATNETHIASLAEGRGDLQVSGRWIIVTNRRFEIFERETGRPILDKFQVNRWRRASFLEGSSIDLNSETLFGFDSDHHDSNITSVDLSGDKLKVQRKSAERTRNKKTYLFPFASHVVTGDGLIYSNELKFKGSLGSGVSGLRFCQAYPIGLVGNEIRIYDADSWLIRGDWRPQKVEAKYHFVFDKKVTVVGETLKDPSSFESKALNQLGLDVQTCVAEEEDFPVPPGQGWMSFEPKDSLIDREGVIYILHPTSQKIFRYSTASGKYLNPIVTKKLTEFMVYNKHTHELLLAYTGGHVTRVNLSQSHLVESDFVQTVVGPLKNILVRSKDYLFLATDRERLAVYSHQGKLKKFHEGRFDDFHGGSNTLNSLMENYFYYVTTHLSPKSLHWRRVDDNGHTEKRKYNTGKKKKKKKKTKEKRYSWRSPYVRGYPMYGPILSSPSGELIVLGSGVVFHSWELSVLARMPEGMTAGLWLEAGLFTVKDNRDRSFALKLWDDNFFAEWTIDQPGQFIGMYKLSDASGVVLYKFEGRFHYLCFDRGGELVLP